MTYLQRKLFLLAVLIAAFAAAQARAGETPARTATTAPSRETPDSAVARFFDEQAIAVIRVDIESLDPKAIQTWLTNVLQEAGMPKGDINDWLTAFRGALTQLQNWKAGFRQAGGRQVYLVVNAGLMIDPPYALAPLEKGADAEAVIAQIEASGLLKIHQDQVTSQPTDPKDAE